MKEALGGISLFQIVIIFILIFTGIMCLTINQSKAFSVKDEIITIIQNAPVEKDNKFSDSTVEKIKNYLKQAGYRTTGDCPDDKWIGYSRDGSEVKNNAAFCVKINDVANAFNEDLLDKCADDKCSISDAGYPNMVYYEIVLFYELDIPVIKYFMNFKTYGATRVLFG